MYHVVVQYFIVATSFPMDTSVSICNVKKGITGIGVQIQIQIQNSFTASHQT